MSIKDTIKKSVLQNFIDSSLTVDEIISLMLISVAIGVFIYLIYRLACNNGFYSKGFNISLMLMPVITATIIVTIQSSVVVSLGMVGALSIVRFRTALKNPLDLLFMFWSISVGIVVGAGLPTIAVIMTVIVAVVLIVARYIPNPKADKLVSVSTSEDEKAIEELVISIDRRAKCKSKNFNGHQTTLLFEAKCNKADEIYDVLKKSNKIASVSVVSNDEQQF